MKIENDLQIQHGKVRSAEITEKRKKVTRTPKDKWNCKIKPVGLIQRLLYLKQRRLQGFWLLRIQTEFLKG
jgi:hypothetical protein